MYADFYRLSAQPFQLTPDPRFFFESSVHRQAMAYLVYGLHHAEGFIIITGEVGAGKTVVAMLAMAASIAAVYPHMNHVGGDGFWLVREPSGRVRALMGELRDIRAQEYREFQAHGWRLPYDDGARIHERLARLDHLVDQIRDEP